MKIGSLFTGYGGLDLATETAFEAQTAWTCDTDPGASKIIAARFPDAPNIGDITTIDWGSIEPVDIITGGWPCQPFSVAGKRKGAADERALWPEVERAVRALRPRYVVLENVSAIATAGTGPELARATASLAALGYLGSWLCLRASDVGAPHRRERIFIVATNSAYLGHKRGGYHGMGGPDLRTVVADLAADTGRIRGNSGRVATPGQTEDGGSLAVSGVRRGMDAVELLPTPTATPYGNNQSQSPGAAVRPSLDSLAPLLPTPRATDGTKGAVNASDTTARRVADGQANLAETALHLGERFGQYADAIARWNPIIGRPAPDPTTMNGRLSPHFVEWMMGLPYGWVCDVPGLTRAQKLRALGNGVVPQQAAAAIQQIVGASR